MGLFSKKQSNKEASNPIQVLEPEDPVNYNSVLDYLVGLSKPDYDKMIKVTGIYREANKSAAKVLGVKDEPVTALKQDKPTDEELDSALDSVLDDPMAFLDDDIEPEKPKKPQATDKKVEIKE